MGSNLSGSYHIPLKNMQEGSDEIICEDIDNLSHPKIPIHMLGKVPHRYQRNSDTDTQRIPEVLFRNSRSYSSRCVTDTNS